MSEHIEKSADPHGDSLGFERLVFFSDAVLAIAITLMALEIRLPELEPEATEQQIAAGLQSLAPHLFVYILSFLVIGLYWTIHHRLFRAIKQYDTRLIWFNLIFLMFVAFIPVATNALGTFPYSPLIIAFYAVSVALVGFAEVPLWLYAVRKGYVVASAAPHMSLYTTIRMLIPPIVFLLSLLLIPFNTDVTRLSWALMIPLIYGVRFAFPREHAERELYSRGTRE